MSFITTLYDLYQSFEDSYAFKKDDTNQEIKKLNHLNTFYGAISKGYRKGVVGLGFNIQNHSSNPNINDEYEKIIKDWSRKSNDSKNRSNCELTGRYFFQEALRQMVDEYAVRQGGFIIAHHYNMAFKYGYKFEIIPLSDIQDYTEDSQHIKNGFVYNSNREITHIYIKDKKRNIGYKKVPYANLTLVINKWADIDQYSGMSPLLRSMEALEYIDNYKAKEMDGAGRRANTPFFIKTPKFKDIFSAVKAKLLSGTTTVDEASLIKENFELRRLDKKDINSQDIAYIDSDEDLIETGKGIITIYPEMYANEIKSASASIGLDASTTAGMTHSSYNAALKASQSEEQEYAIIAQEIVESCLREVVGIRLFRGLLMVNAFSESEKIKTSLADGAKSFDDYISLEFIRAEVGHIDPVKSAKATTEHLSNGTTTHIRELSKRGIDMETHLNEIERFELAKLEKLKMIKVKYKEAGFEYNPNTESTITDEELDDDDSK